MRIRNREGVKLSESWVTEAASVWDGVVNVSTAREKLFETNCVFCVCPAKCICRDVGEKKGKLFAILSIFGAGARVCAPRQASLGFFLAVCTSVGFNLCSVY